MYSVELKGKRGRSSFGKVKVMHLRERLMRFLFGKERKIVVLVPHEDLEEIALIKQERTKDEEKRD